MARYHCGSGTNPTWFGKTWTTQTYNGTWTTDRADLVTKSSAVWDEIKTDYTYAQNKSPEYYGIHMKRKADWTGGGLTIPIMQFFPTSLPGTTGWHTPRPDQDYGSSPIEYTPNAGADSVTLPSLTNYNAALAATDLIIARSIDYSGLVGSDRARTLAFAYMHPDQSGIYWDTAPPYFDVAPVFTNPGGSGTLSGTWSCANDDTGYQICITFRRTSGSVWVGQWYYPTSDDGFTITSAEANYAHDQMLCAICRYDGSSSYQAVTGRLVGGA